MVKWSKSEGDFLLPLANTIYYDKYFHCFSYFAVISLTEMSAMKTQKFYAIVPGLVRKQLTWTCEVGKFLELRWSLRMWYILKMLL